MPRAQNLFRWSLGVWCAAPVVECQSLTVLSYDPDASVLPSGDNATVITPSEWPLSAQPSAPVVESQSLTVISYDPDASVLPSGENATAITLFEWPLSV